MRGKTEWYGLVEFISNQKQRLATESEKRERIEAGIKSKMEVCPPSAHSPHPGKGHAPCTHLPFLYSRAKADA